MKLLIDISGYLPKKSFGALTFMEGFLKDLNENLALKQHKIFILSSRETIEYFSNLTNLNFIKIWVPSNPFLRVFYLHLIISSKFNSVKPDAVFSPLEIAYPTEIPNAVYVHDIISKYYIDNIPSFNPKRNIILWQRVKLSLKNSDLILTPSDFTKNEILRFVKITSPIKVVREGSPSGRIEYIETEINFSNKNILIPSYKAIHKPIFQLVDSLSVIKKMQPSILSDLQLIFTGSFDAKTERLFKSIRKIDNRIKLICTGFINGKQVNYLYSRAKAVLFITDYEGFGLPMIESDYFGVPIVCTDIPVLREIKNNNTLFYEKDNINDLAEKIIEAISIDKKFQSSYMVKWERFNEELFFHLENLIKNSSPKII
jgi:glycosyltransferase involved in cell wall biosynthesis